MKRKCQLCDDDFGCFYKVHIDCINEFKEENKELRGEKE